MKLMKLIKISRYQVRVIVMTFQGHGFKSQGHEQRLPKMHFSAEAYRVMVRRRRPALFYQITSKVTVLL